ncbi:hypothetical protein AAFH96_16625, partial [Polymorphospora sp. 2-325]
LRPAAPPAADVPVIEAGPGRGIPAPRRAGTLAPAVSGGPADHPVVPTPAARRRRDRMALALALVPLALVLLEGVNRTPHPPAPPAPLALRDVAEPLLILPPEGIAELHYMLWSTDGFPRIANGLAAHVPQTQAQTRTMTVSFPDAASIDYLRGLGVRTVVVLPGYLPGTGWQDMLDRPIDGLPVCAYGRRAARLPARHRLAGHAGPPDRRPSGHPRGGRRRGALPARGQVTHRSPKRHPTVAVQCRRAASPPGAGVMVLAP